MGMGTSPGRDKLKACGEPHQSPSPSSLACAALGMWLFGDNECGTERPEGLRLWWRGDPHHLTELPNSLSRDSVGT